MRFKFQSLGVLAFYLSLDTFHRGQRAALDGDIPTALSCLQESLEIARRSDQWTNYIEATIAYLRNDREVLSFKAGQVTLNKGTLQRLIDGLQTFGSADYKRDYPQDRPRLSNLVKRSAQN